jgi:hypothetical protein
VEAGLSKELGLRFSLPRAFTTEGTKVHEGKRVPRPNFGFLTLELALSEAGGIPRSRKSRDFSGTTTFAGPRSRVEDQRICMMLLETNPASPAIINRMVTRSAL